MLRLDGDANVSDALEFMQLWTSSIAWPEFLLYVSGQQFAKFIFCTRVGKRQLELQTLCWFLGLRYQDGSNGNVNNIFYDVLNMITQKVYSVFFMSCANILKPILLFLDIAILTFFIKIGEISSRLHIIINYKFDSYLIFQFFVVHYLMHFLFIVMYFYAA